MGSGVKKTRASGDVGTLQTLAEARAASGRFLNYGKQHKKIRVRKTLGLADFGGSAGGLRPLFELWETA